MGRFIVGALCIGMSALGCLVFGTFLGWCGQSLESFFVTKKYLRNPKESSSDLEASFWPDMTASVQKVLQLPVLREPMGRTDSKVNSLTKKYCLCLQTLLLCSVGRFDFPASHNRLFSCYRYDAYVILKL